MSAPWFKRSSKGLYIYIYSDSLSFPLVKGHGTSSNLAAGLYSSLVIKCWDGGLETFNMARELQTCMQLHLNKLESLTPKHNLLQSCLFGIYPCIGTVRLVLFGKKLVINIIYHLVYHLQVIDKMIYNVYIYVFSHSTIISPC